MKRCRMEGPSKTKALSLDLRWTLEGTEALVEYW